MNTRRSAMAMAAAVVSLGSLAMVSPAGAVDQIVTGTIGGSVAISTDPTASVTFPAMPAAGVSQVSGGTIGVTGNLAWTLSVKSLKATMGKYASGAYADPAVSLATPMAIVPVLASGVGVGVPVPAVGTTDSTLATGALGTATFTLTLAQTTVPADVPATYRNTLTYTAAAAL